MIFKLIKILVLALLLPVSANANFHSDSEEWWHQYFSMRENERISKLIMQYGEIIHSAPMKDSKGDETSAIYHVRINKGSPNRMKLDELYDGIYVCFVTVARGTPLEFEENLFSCVIIAQAQ